MKKAYRTMLLIFAALFLCGCVNVLSRSDKPYLCARHPYYCTAVAWTDCVCAPLNVGKSNDPIWTSFATLTWPFWVLDEVAEVALDTVFLPVDGIYTLYKDVPNKSHGETEKTEEVR